MSTLTIKLDSQNHWLADGTQTVWNFEFSDGYINRSHVRAYYSTPAAVPGDPPVRTDLVIDPNTSFVGDFQLLITPAVADGDTLVIYRATPRDMPLVDFQDGGGVTELNLDTTARQAVFLAQEAADFVGVSTTADLQDLANTAITAAGSAAASAVNAAAAASSADADAAYAESKATQAESAATAAAGSAANASSAATTAVNAYAATQAVKVTTKHVAVEDNPPVADLVAAAFQSNRTVTRHGGYSGLASDRLDYTGNALDPLVGSAGFNDNSTLVGGNPTIPGVVDHRYSFQAYHHVVMNVGGILAQYSAFFSQLDVQSGSVTAARLVDLNNPLGAGTIGSLVGVNIGNLTRASVAANNWGIRSLTKQSFFAEYLFFGDTAGASYGSFGYDPAGHMTVKPRPGYAFRIAGAAGDRRLRLGSIGGDSDDSILEQRGDGVTVLTPRPGFGTLLQGTVEIGGALAATNLPVIFRPYTVATLPPAATWVNSRCFVSDANATTFNSIVAAGGTNKVPVFSDGTNWRIG